jgi:hypothetical protein
MRRPLALDWDSHSSRTINDIHYFLRSAFGYKAHYLQNLNIT